MPVRRIRARWWVDFRHGGERYRRCSPLNTKAGAREYELTLRGRLARAEPIAGVAPRTGPRTRFSEFSDTWVSTYVVPNNKPSERYAKVVVLRHHLIPWFGRFPLETIGTANVEAYKAAKLASGLSAKTVNNHLAVLGRCLRSAVEWDLIATAPRIKQLKAAPPGFDCLNADEVARLLARCEEPQWRAMIRLAVRTGLRLGELLALRWEDTDLARRRLAVRRSVWRSIVTTTKTYRERYVPLSTDCCSELAGFAEASGFIFGAAAERTRAHSTARKALHRACWRANLRPIGWHVLRHTFASDLASAGVPLHVVQALLGHATLTMTQRYAHLAPDAFADAIAVLEKATGACGPRENGQPAVNATPMQVPPAPQPAAA